MVSVYFWACSQVISDSITNGRSGIAFWLPVSRQCEKFLIGQSRKFLLTVENWKDGTNRDEPGGTRLAGVAEESARRGRHAAAGSRKDGGERTLGAQAAGALEDRWRWGQPFGRFEVLTDGVGHRQKAGLGVVVGNSQRPRYLFLKHHMQSCPSRS